jgi:hypothetical protein
MQTRHIPAQVEASRCAATDLSPKAIAIFSGADDVDVLRRAVQYYHESNVTLPVTIICPSNTNLGHLNTLCSIVFDEDLPGYNEVSRWLKDHEAVIQARSRATGWYLQQFLKLSYALLSKETIFISDGDTIFSSRRIQALVHCPHVIATRENVGRYESFLADCGLASRGVSFIANGGIANSRILAPYVNTPCGFFLRALDSFLKLKSVRSDFSEYQLLGAVAAKYVPVHEVRLFRRYDLIVSRRMLLNGGGRVERALFNYDAIAFEYRHASGPMRRLAARAMLSLGYRW